jgi:glutamyl-tRNA reductase
MLKMGLVGASIHEAPLELLSALTIPVEERERRLPELAKRAGFVELVYLATCNRVEFIFTTEEERPLHVSRNRILDYFFQSVNDVSFAPENFYGHGGIEAARHLFTVASALDSLVIGEAQVLGQVKEAWSTACEWQLAGDRLAPVFRAAFRCAKRVRRETEIGAHRLSMVSLAAEVLKEFTREVPGARIAIVGAGPMTAKLAEAAAEAGCTDLLFVNRTVSKLEGIAKGRRTLDLDTFRAQPPLVDAVLTSTSAPLAIFGREETETLLGAGDPNRPFLFLDLAVPRDVADDVAEITNVRLWNVSTLRNLAGKNRRERFRAADRAHEIVNEDVARFHGEVVEAVLSPLFGETHQQALEFATSGLESLFAGRLGHLSPEDRESVRYWVINKLVPGVVHLPLKAMAKSAGTHGHPSEEPPSGESVRVHAGGVEVRGVRFAPPSC